MCMVVVQQALRDWVVARGVYIGGKVVERGAVAAWQSPRWQCTFSDYIPPGGVI